MTVEHLHARDVDDVIDLWADVELTRPWNDPRADFLRALEGPSSTVLGVRQGDTLVGTVMVGHDGHRGWVYYLAVRDTNRHQGYASSLMREAEAWLRSVGAVKTQLMVRRTNTDVVALYERLGYQESEVVVLAKWLT